MNVSILIATYGDDEWRTLALQRALPSAQHQGVEVLCEHQPDATIASVRNALAEKASGDWLCYLDADDELAPGYIDAMARVASEHVLLTPAVRQIRKGIIHRPTFYKEVDLFNANWLVVGTLLERDLFMRVGGFEDYPHGFEDWSLWYKCARLGARVIRVPRAIYIQHVNPESKHRQGWRDRKWQVATHERVKKELDQWEVALT